MAGAVTITCTNDDWQVQQAKVLARAAKRLLVGRMASLAFIAPAIA